MSSLPEKISKFPTTPGVYIMKGEGDKIIYVGKAKNLRTRVRQYFGDHDGRYQVSFLMKRVHDIDILITHTEKEALLLENSLIKKHKPRYNIFLKDDKSYVSLKLTTHHPFPSLTVTRKIRKDGSLYFGPYSSAMACRETVDFIYRHFRLRTCSDRELMNRSRPCLEYQIQRCTAPCVNYITQDQYADQVEQVRLFLSGKNEDLMQKIKLSIKEFSQKEAFEEAARLRDLLMSIEETLEKQRVVRHGGLHQDLIAFHREGKKVALALLTVRDGTLIDSRTFVLDSLEEDALMLEHFLSQYYLGEVFIPDEILVSLPLDDTHALTDLLTDKRGKKVGLRMPQKGDKKELLDLAYQNAKSHFVRSVQKEVQVQEALDLLKQRLELPQVLHRIECYDISNISGKMATGSRVTFIDGVPDKKFYRHYKIRLKSEPDDYAMMREVLTRRFQSEDPHPDLLIVDGGKGQLKVALQVLQEASLSSIPVMGVAKGSGQGARAKGLWEGKKEEEIYLPHRKNAVIFKKGSPELMLLQRIRDEAHRFALKYHRKLRDELSLPTQV